ncbi:hypothetical protein [Streptomyces platensis]|uniref:hypothetical protein n=1 Tax=Streptomyces platensis TaxID=58346 RepID=UPI003795720B
MFGLYMDSLIARHAEPKLRVSGRCLDPRGLRADQIRLVCEMVGAFQGHQGNSVVHRFDIDRAARSRHSSVTLRFREVAPLALPAHGHRQSMPPFGLASVGVGGGEEFGVRLSLRGAPHRVDWTAVGSAGLCSACEVCGGGCDEHSWGPDQGG